MAEIHFYRIQFAASNPYGEFVNGDVVDIYYDDTTIPEPFPSGSTVGAVVYKNSVKITSGADIVSDTTNYKTTIAYSPLVCYTTSAVNLTRTNMAFPYVYVSALANHPLCANNGPVCDLIFSGAPVITSASSDQTDGAVTVTASSSNSPIQYRLNNDFSYGDGNGQSSGTFSGLAGGQYRIYARDSVNCGANILVTIPEKTIAYNPVYRLEYDDPVGGVSRVDITQRNFAGTVTEIKGASIGFERSLKGEASQDKFESILATKATLHLTSETNFAFSGLYTNNPDEFRLEYSKLTDAAATSSVSLPTLSTWLSGDTSADKRNWTTGAAPEVTIAGAAFPNYKQSELLYTDYAFIDGRAYTLSLTYTRTTNSGSSNPRTAVLQVTDVSNNVVFEKGKAASEGSNTITLSFTANVLCERIAFYFSSGMNVTITVNSIAGTIDGYANQGIYKVLPQQYGEDYAAAPYHVSVVATDGLPSLKEYVFLQDDGQRFNSSMKAITLIAFILKKTGLPLSIRCAINLYATGMNTAATDDPLDQAYVDCDTYYINETEPTLDYVLRQIIEPYGASIVQENAVWNIVRVEEKRASYDYREFDYNGAYVTNSSYNPLLDVQPHGTAGFHFSDRDHFMQICPGYGKIRVFYRLGLRENILENGDFRLTSVYDAERNEYFFTLDTFGFQLVNTGGTLTSSWESIEQTRQSGGVFSPISLNDDTSNIAWKIEAGVSDSGYILSDSYNLKMGVANSLKIAVRLKVPTAQTVNLRVQYGLYYLQADGTWTLTETSIGIVISDVNKYIEHEVTAGQPDAGAKNGYDFNVRLYVDSTLTVDFIKVAYLTNGSAPVDTILREINAEPKNTAVLEKEVTHGSYQSLITTIPQWNFGIGKLTATSSATLSLITTNILSADVLYAGYLRNSSGTGWTTWTRDGISESSSLHAILLQQYAAQYKKSWRKLTGSFYSQSHYFNFLNVLRVVNDSNRLYLPISPTIDDVNNRVRGEFLELIDITSGAGSDGSSGSPFTSGFSSGFGGGYN